MLMVDAVRAAKIRRLNDDSRIHYRNARFMITKGVLALGIELKAIDAFRKFRAFTPDNDHWGEHNCFLFEVEGHKLIAKCDYYTPDMAYGSDDPTSTSPNICVRCWTIMNKNEF